MNAELLNQLRDIHAPAAVSWWPLAPGWYVLAGLIFVSALLGSYFGWKYYRRRRYLKSLLQELDHLQQDLDRGNANALMQLSILMRRIALTRFSRQDIASLSGAAWLKFLDNSGAIESRAFSEGIGQVLAYGPYQQHVAVNATELMHLVRQWLNKVVVT